MQPFYWHPEKLLGVGGLGGLQFASRCRDAGFVIWSSKKGHTGDARASGRDEGRGFLR